MYIYNQLCHEIYSTASSLQHLQYFCDVCDITTGSVYVCPDGLDIIYECLRNLEYNFDGS